jgi:hypothetical protein
MVAAATSGRGWGQAEVGKKNTVHAAARVSRDTQRGRDWMAPTGTGVVPGTARDVATFVRFRDYDWAADTAFLAGLASMQVRWAQEQPPLTDAALADRMRGAQLFYFHKCVRRPSCPAVAFLAHSDHGRGGGGRYVAPLDADAYQQWAADEAIKAQHGHYRRFQAHDFAGDATYQASLPRLLADLRARGLQGHDLDRELLRSRMFYYGAYVVMGSAPQRL